MTEAIATRSASNAVATISPEDKQTLKDTICKDLNDSQLKLFVGFCQSRGFGPLDKRVAPWVDRDGRLVMVTTIDGKRTIAHRTGLYDGRRGPFYCGPDGKWTEVWLKSERPVACMVETLRKGCSEPFRTVLLAKEYKGGPVSNSMPVYMHGKACESLSLSAAFPEECGNLYTDDEIPEARAAVARLADNSVVDVVQPKPAPTSRLTLESATKPAAEVVVETTGEVVDPEPESFPADTMPVYANAADVLKGIKALTGIGITKEEIYGLLGGDSETFEVDVDKVLPDDLAKARQVYKQRAKKD